MHKIFIIGANGFLGAKCIPYFSKKWEVVAADIDKSCIPSAIRFVPFNLTLAEEIQAILQQEMPDLVLLCAAMTDVDKCEVTPDLAYAINRDGPKIVAQICRDISARLLFISTDFVFDGLKKGKYVETDSAYPLSVYGKSKLEAETAILESGCDALICRTAVLYGWPLPAQRDNFTSWLVKSLQGGQKVRIVTSQYNTPTYVDNLAECLSKMTSFSGAQVYHTVGSTGLSRYDFATKLADVFGFSRHLVESTLNFTQKAQRPPFACLANQKASQDFKVHFATIDEGLLAMKKQFDMRNNARKEN